MMKRNLPQNLNDLRSGCMSPKKFIKHQHVTGDLIKRLRLDKELTGHNGCVNCIEWNETGELLASGSDDTHVMIWDPFNFSRKMDLSTNHKGNIFSVKFMPKFNNTKLISGAADSVVKIIDISRETIIEDYSCHTNRIKRLAVSYSEPYLLWSCSEDGTIRQFDIRENSNMQCKRDCNCKNVLVDLNSYIGSSSEVKCLAINPIRSDQLAVGSSDPYVRLYDRRKLSLKSHHLSESRKNRGSIKKYSNGVASSQQSLVDELKIPDDVVRYFVPGHIPHTGISGAKFGPAQLSTTYLTFSPDGNSLLVNMGSEQIYLYDINKTNPSFSFQNSLGDQVMSYNGASKLLCDYSCCEKSQFERTASSNFTDNKQQQPFIIEQNGELPYHLELLKEEGNKKYKDNDFHSAIMHYNISLQKGGDKYARFYANRAASYISRNWTGDIYAALHDSIRALALEPDHIKSHFRIAQCLFQLNMIAEASDYIKYIQCKFPDQAKKIKQVGELDRKITDKISDFIIKENKDKNKDTPPANGSKNTNSKNGSEMTNATNLLEIISKHSKTRRFSDFKNVSSQELKWRMNASDYIQRYCGHCNTTTDIKEANFFGIDGQYIMAGSDDGNIFFWDRNTENIIRVLSGDSNIVNCLQPHPTVCFLASSGIDNVVRLWSPSYSKESCEESSDLKNSPDDNEIIGIEQNEFKAAQSNQDRLHVDPFEVVLMNMGLHATYMNRDDNEDDDGVNDNERDDRNDSSSNTGRRSRRRRLQQIDNEYCRAS